MKRDTVIALIGAGILLVVMVAVFRFEAAQGASTLGSQGFDVTWSTATAPGPGAKGFVAAHAKNTTALDVRQPNLTHATFALAWTDDVGEPDTFRFTVTSPAGASKTAEGTSGLLRLEFDGLNDKPAATSAFGDTQTVAAGHLAAQHTKLAGTGAWTVVVECVNAAGTRLPLPNSPELQPDPGNAYTVASNLTRYAPTFTAKT